MRGKSPRGWFHSQESTRISSLWILRLSSRGKEGFKNGNCVWTKEKKLRKRRATWDDKKINFQDFLTFSFVLFVGSLLSPHGRRSEKFYSFSLFFFNVISVNKRKCLFWCYSHNEECSSERQSLSADNSAFLFPFFGNKRRTRDLLRRDLNYLQFVLWERGKWKANDEDQKKNENFVNLSSFILWLSTLRSAPSVCLVQQFNFPCHQFCPFVSLSLSIRCLMLQCDDNDDDDDGEKKESH